EDHRREPDALEEGARRAQHARLSGRASSTCSRFGAPSNRRDRFLLLPQQAHRVVAISNRKPVPTHGSVPEVRLFPENAPIKNPAGRGPAGQVEGGNAQEGGGGGTTAVTDRSATVVK